ncbi:MAG TPA: hypothetical protein VFQ43_11100 [Nitrososphaera sp.]|nr:hypothetical protein [Nitrososphaera sp.]
MEKFPSQPKPKQESKEARTVLSREEVLKAIEQHVEGYTIERELSDAKGLYLLEARVVGEKPGKVTEYRYHRQGEAGKSTQTVIYVTYYENDIPVGGATVANYNEKTRAWETAN